MGEMQARNFYLALAIVALLVSFWLTIQMAGIVVQLLFCAAIAVLAVAVARSWHAAGG